MSDLDGLLAGIVADPHENTRWLVLADWLEEHDDPRRAELLRLRCNLLASAREPDANPERVGWHSRLVELIGQGAAPCVPRVTIPLPGCEPMAFSFVPPGRFRMGSEDPVYGDIEGPVRVVTLTKSFYLGCYAVTQEQWRAVMGTDPSLCPGVGHPVERVSWRSAMEFCSRLAWLTNRAPRLPTEAEWEYACRAGTTTDYYTGDGEAALELAAWYDRRGTHPVGLKAPNAWGLFDMHGNVWEHVDAEAVRYSALPDVDPHVRETYRPGSAAQRVRRGGGCSSEAVYCRAAARSFGEPDGTGLGCGFRVALTA